MRKIYGVLFRKYLVKETIAGNNGSYYQIQGGSCRSSIQFWQATNFNTIFDILIGPDRTRCVCVSLPLSLSLSSVSVCVCVISGSDHHFCKGLGFLLHDHPKTFPLLESRISILDFKARWKTSQSHHLATWPSFLIRICWWVSQFLLGSMTFFHHEKHPLGSYPVLKPSNSNPIDSCSMS